MLACSHAGEGGAVASTFLRFCLGFVRLHLRGRALAAFVNACAAAGDPVWSLRRIGPDEAEAVMRLDGFRRCRAAARATHTRVHILDRGGLPFRLRTVAGRPVLVLGALAVVAALWVFGSRIWVVQVRGGDPRAQAEVVAAAAALGLRAGALRSAIDPGELSEDLAARVPSIAWAAVRIQGVRVDLTIAERVTGAGESAASGPYELVAASDGIVTRVLALRGRALVVPGQTVVRGQALIAGADGQSPRGAVMAHVWYHKATEIALRREISVPTGREVERWRLVLFGWRIGLGAATPLPFADYQLVTRQWTIRWRALELPIALQSLTYREVDRVLRQLTPQEAAGEGAAAAEADLRRQLPAGARAGEPTFTYVPLGGAAVMVSVTLPAEEDIAVPRALPAP